MTSTFVLDQNNSDTELGKSRINMTLFRFYNKWKKVQSLGAFLKQVLPRVIMSSTKESDLNALTFCWNGRDGRCHKLFFSSLESLKPFLVSSYLQLKPHITNTVQENTDKRHTATDNKKAGRSTSAHHCELYRK